MSKMIAVSACCTRTVGQKHIKNRHQRGVSLIELMVGIAIGLLVVAVAGGALMVSRGVSGTVSDASLIQQQAGFAFRTIGQQVRQAGSLYLNPNPKNNTSTDIDRYALPVAFETKAVSPAAGRSFTPNTDTITGTDTTLTVAYRRYKEAVFKEKTADPDNQSLTRDCLGGPTEANTADNDSFMRLQSAFVLNGSTLRCTGTPRSDLDAGSNQPIIGNVANFRIRYLQLNNDAPGDPKIQYVNAATAASNWGRVTGIEVCLVLYGNERMGLPTGSNYRDCDGTTDVDMSNAASTDMNGTAIGAARAGRMHMVFRNIYQLRSQGLIGSVM